MEYTFRTGETPGQAVARVASEQLELGIADLVEGSQPVALRVHEFRKRCKKLRALLRLSRKRFPGSKARARRFGELGRELCVARDARIMADLAAMLLGETGSGTAAGESPVALYFREHCEAEEAAVSTLLPGIAGEVRSALDDVATWELESVTIETLMAGFSRTLAQARKAFAAARSAGTPEAFHDLRKRCKDHWYHLCLLAPMLPQRLKPRRNKFDRLCNTLGLSQDCSVLLAHITALPADLLVDDDAACLLRAAAAQRDSLHADILVTAEPLLDVEPGRIAARVGGQWRRLQAQKNPAQGGV